MKQYFFILLTLLIPLLLINFAISSEKINEAAVKHSQEISQRTSKIVFSIPVELMDATPLAEVTINNKGPYTFLVDTGVNVGIVLSDSLFKELSIQHTETMVITNPYSNSSREASLFKIASLDINDFNFQNIDGITMDLEQFSKIIGKPLHGILGFQFFKDYLLKIDYPQQKLELITGNLDRTMSENILPYDPNEGIPIINVFFDGTLIPIIIDSGNSGYFRIPFSYGSYLTFSQGPIDSFSMVTISGEIPHQLQGRVKEDVTLGNFRITSPLVSLIPTTEPWGIMGGHVIKNFVLTFDQKNNLVHFGDDSCASISIPPLRTFGIAFDKYPDSWIVHDIIPETKAELFDIQIGDHLIYINGVSIHKISVTWWRTLPESVDSVKLTFVRMKDTTEMTFVHEIPVTILIP